MKYNSQFNKLGLSLIELLLVTALSAIILSSLALTLRFILQSRQIVENTVSFGSRVTLLQTQFDRDFAGVVVPVPSEATVTTTTTTTPQQAQQTDKPKAANETQKKANRTANREEKKEEEKAQLVFYASVQGKDLEKLSFVTDNSIAALVSSAVEKTLPHVVRVIYHLVPDNRHAGSFILLREERADLGKSFLEGDKESSKRYELIDGIAHLSLTYGFVIVEEQKKGEQKQPEQKEQKRINTTAAWQPGKKEKLPPFPHFIKMELSLWDSAYRKQQKYILYFEQLLSVERKKEQQQSSTSRPARPLRQQAPPKLTMSRT